MVVFLSLATKNWLQAAPKRQGVNDASGLFVAFLGETTLLESIHAYFLGHINPAIMGLLIVGVIPGAYVGGHVAVLMRESTPSRLFGLFLIRAAVCFGLFEAGAVFGSRP